MRHYEDLNLTDSSMRDRRDVYLKEVRIQRKVAKPAEMIVVTKFPVDDQCLLAKSICNKS